MMRVRLGIAGKYLLALAAGFVLLALLVYGGWRMQRTANEELAALLTRSMQAQGEESLERRGESVAMLAADALANPVYFVDLKAIGEIARSALHQADVEYVLVYDAQGRILHDGSMDIVAFGMPMRDAFAAGAVVAAAPLIQFDDAIVDVTHPLFLGKERLGGVRVGLSRKGMHAVVQAASDELNRNAVAQFEYRLGVQALPVLGLLALALLSAFMVMRGLVRPIRQLANHARAPSRTAATTSRSTASGRMRSAS